MYSQGHRPQTAVKQHNARRHAAQPAQRPAEAIMQQLASVVHNPTRERFELWVAGDLVGVLGYSTEDIDGQHVVTILHTVLFDEYTGHGLASRLAAGAMRYAMDTGSSVRPVCSFIQHFLQRNPTFAALAV